jgi:hypothetical protein
MSFLTVIASQAMAFIWGNHPQVQHTPTSTEIFKKHLSAFAAVSVDRRECIENCVQASKNMLQPADCDLSETSKAAIELHLENFNTAVDQTSYLTKDDAEDLKIRFKQSLCEVVVDKWADVVAKSFYPILSISDEQEKVVAAQKWTRQYFEGVDYFNKWIGFFLFVRGEFVATLQQKTSLAFHTYSFEVIQKKMETMHTRAEKDPISFGRMMDEVEAKLEKDPTSLSVLEKEYVELAKALACCITHHWPDIDKKMDLLKKCIWSGYALQKFRTPTPGHDISQRLFADTFKKV